MGNRRNMTPDEERAFLEPFREKAARGEALDTKEIRDAYEAAVGHSIGSGQIYYVLHRQGWRKVKPRSRHEKAADKGVQDTQKKLKPASGKWNVM